MTAPSPMPLPETSSKTETMAPLCKDCRHAKRALGDLLFMPFRSYTFAKCAASERPGDREVLELIDGRSRNRKPELHFCQTWRRYGDCGPEGALYEAKAAVS